MLPPSDDSVTGRARAGDREALASLLRDHEAGLLRMVQLRIDPALQRRMEPEDIVQDALGQASKRFDEWRALPQYPFRVWLRLLTAQALAEARRKHLGAQMRSALRDQGAANAGSSISRSGLTERFMASQTSPSGAAMREEMRERVARALEGLEPLDQEVLALRHFEGLSNEDVAQELEITAAAASKRYVRALQRLRPLLDDLGGQSSAG